jgi:hypothetical protein
MNKARFLLNVMVWLALSALGAGTLAAQIIPAANGVPAKMVVTEEARQGSNAPGIGPENIIVHQGHNRYEVTGWVPAQGDNAGLELYILLDDDSTASLGSQLGDIRQFIAEQPDSAKIGVAYMRNGIGWIVQKPTSDHTLAAKALRLPLRTNGGNGSPYFALSDLIKRWPKSDARREVLMISDGVDRYYEGDDLQDPYLAETIAKAQRAGVVVSAIYTPGVGTYSRSSWQTFLGQVYMTQVAQQTGGQAYYMGFDAPAVAFAPYLRDLANRLNHQYLLSFVPEPQQKAGLEPVKLTTETPNAELTAADRVYVPAGR